MSVLCPRDARWHAILVQPRVIRQRRRSHVQTRQGHREEPRTSRFAKASIYDIGNRAETGDFSFSFHAQTDRVVNVGVICSRKRRTRDSEILLLTENGTFEMLPFAASASRYYNVIWQSAACALMLRESVRRARSGAVLPHDVHLPFDFVRVNHDSFNATVLKVWLPDPFRPPPRFGKGERYEATREAVFLHQS